MKCPRCQGVVMPFSLFVLKAEPNNTISCQSCGSTLKRNPSVWLLLISASVVLLAAAILIMIFHGPVFMAQKIGIIIFLTLVFFFGLKFVGWKYIGWQVAEPRRPEDRN